jgi:MFS transporter, DHA2 family, multidrug resistance protein
VADLHPGLPFPRRAFAILAASIGAIMLQIDVSIAGVLLPTIAHELNVENATIVLVVTVYQLILAMALLPLSALGERMGYRRLFQASLVLHSVAAFFYLFANSLPMLIAVRSLQAFATAAAMSVSVGQLRAIYPATRLGSGLALNTVANSSGTVLAPVIGGLILSVASWHWAFAAVVPLSMLALLFSRFLPDPQPHRQPFDLIGAMLCALTFGLVISGLECAIHSSHLFLSLGIVALGAVSARVLIRYEMRQAEPVLPINLLQLPVVALSVISCFCAVLGSIMLMLFLPFRLQHDYGFNPGEIGGMMAAYAIASFMVAPTAGYLSDRVPIALLSTIGMIVASIGLLCVAFLPAHPTHFDIAWRIWFSGAGFGMFFSPNARLIIASAPPSRSAAAASLFTTSRMLGQATGATVIAALLALKLGNGPVPALVAMCLTVMAGAISASSLRRANSLK